MTGIIEPSVRNAEDPAARKREPGEEPDSSIIPSVAEHASAGVGPSTKVALALAGLVVVSALVFMLWRVIFRPLRLDPKAAPPAAVASASGAAKTFDTLPPVPAETARPAAGEDELPAVPAIEADQMAGSEGERQGAARAFRSGGYSDRSRMISAAGSAPAGR
jgi:hypothetical protein